MKIIITETQEENLKVYEGYKKMFFKYWDKFGPGYDKSLLKLFGSNNYGVIVGEWGKIHKNNVEDFLREWWGDDKAIKKSKELLFNNPHKISNGECGGYDFEFTVDSAKIDGDLFCGITIDDVNGKVQLIMTDNSILTLKDALNNEDYGWEVNNECEDCIWEYLYKLITEKTGVRIVISKQRYSSNRR